MARLASCSRAGRRSTSADVRPVLDSVLAAALAAVEPGRAVHNALSLRDHTLRAGDRSYDLSEFRRALVVGAGKASAPMAAALEELLGSVVPIEGCVSVRYGHTASTRCVAIREAGHPVPDAAGVEATQEIEKLLRGADARDLVICVISGGGSALLTLPEDGITLDD